MSNARHEIPTHLNVEDKAFYGLSVRQVMYLSVGVSGAYSLWNGWPHLAVALKLAVIAACLLVALILALVRPYGRGLEEWLFVGLRYLALPKTCVWRVRDPDRHPDPLGGERWEELTLDLTWKEGDA
ncbi:MAG: PrgI family protein [Anaerolineae bacterium]|nr:PrgI family protein [Anaerolineae bacterium]